MLSLLWPLVLHEERQQRPLVGKPYNSTVHTNPEILKEPTVKVNQGAP